MSVNKKILYVMLIMISISISANYTASIDFKDNTGLNSYFCNPCYYTVYNETSLDLTGQTHKGANSIDLSLRENTDYTLRFTANIGGTLNLTDQYIQRDNWGADETISVNYTEIVDRGSIAYVTSSSTYDYKGIGGTIKNKAGYSFNEFSNITRSLGYDRINLFNFGSNYSLTSTITPITAFNNYALVYVGSPSISVSTTVDNDLLSDEVVNALQTAMDNGVKVILPTLQYNQFDKLLGTNQYGSETDAGLIRVNKLVDLMAGSPSYHIAGMIRNNGESYPDGTYLVTKGGYGVYPDSTTTNYISSGIDYVNVWELNRGQISSINAIVYTDTDTDTPNAPLYKIIGTNLIVVPSFLFFDGATTEGLWTPVDRALMYGTLENFLGLGSRRYNVTFNAKLSSCGTAFDSVEGVSCKIGSTSCTTSGRVLSTEQKDVILTYGSAYTGRKTTTRVYVGGSTDKLLHSDDDTSYLTTDWYGIYKRDLNGIISDSPTNVQYAGDPMFIMGQSLDTKTSMNPTNAISKSNYTDFTMFTSSDGLFTDEYILTEAYHIVNNENLYNITITSDTQAFINKEAHYPLINVLGSWVDSPVLDIDQGCTSSQNWRISQYSGLNSTTWAKTDITCNSGSVSTVRTNTTRLICPANASKPLPIKLETSPDGKIYITRTSVTRVQNLNGASVKHFAGVLDTNITMTYTANTTSDSSCSIPVYEGLREYTCYAPSGYEFQESQDYILTKNVSVSGQIPVTIVLNKQRPLGLKITVYNIDENLKVPVKQEGVLCSIPTQTVISNDEGVCFFKNVLANTEYIVSVTSPTINDIITMNITTGDYSDTLDIDGNLETCANFDGNFSFYLNLDNKYMIVITRPRVQCGTQEMAKGLVVFSVDDKSCVTPVNSGTCIIDNVDKKINGNFNIEITNVNNAQYRIIDRSFIAKSQQAKGDDITAIGNTSITDTLLCYGGYSTCIIKSYVELENSSSIDCTSSEFLDYTGISDISGGTSNGFGILLDILNGMLQNKLLIGAVIVVGTVTYLTIMTKIGLIGILSGMMVMFSLSDLTLGEGLGYFNISTMIIMFFILAIIGGIMFVTSGRRILLGGD